MFFKKTSVAINHKYRGFEKSIILMVDGGLGSQLVKYFIGQLIHKTTNATVMYDLSWFNNHGKSIDNKNNRFFQLNNVFNNLDLKIAEKDQIDYYKRKLKYVNYNPFSYNKEIFTKRAPYYLDGYFGNYRYLKRIADLGLNKLDFKINLTGKNYELSELILSSTNSIGVHVRRGDYVGSAHDVLEVGYYIGAIEYIKTIMKNPVFFIFSDDRNWVKENIIPQVSKCKIYLVDENNNDEGGIDFYLLTKCKNHITSNASFGYLSAYLNTNINKIVIIPQYWMKDPKNTNLIDKSSEKSFRYPSWLVMANNGLIIDD
jgi:hypothetical protein